ncbi:hypothetical protein BJX96DRAFT_165005 [Aspergillus floccosus]
MNADQLLYQMDHSSTQNEWYDFENFFEFPSGCLDSNSTSVDSISPKEYDLSYNDVEGLEWDSAQLPVSDMVSYESSFVDQALGMSDLNADPNDFLQFPPQSPKEDLAAPALSNTLPFDIPSNADSFYSTLRLMVESQAAVEPHGSSQKEKRRDAAIAIHLQRLQGTSIPDLELFPEAPGFPSPPGFSSAHCGPSESPASVSLSESTSKSSTPPSVPDSTPGGMELVLDLNMNTPANLPRKQKPRSRAQKENYIKVRKHGACEKHRKQHKRCRGNVGRYKSAHPWRNPKTIHMADNSKANQCRAQSTTNKRLGSKPLAPGGSCGSTSCSSRDLSWPFPHYEYTNPKIGGPAVGYDTAFNPSQIEPPGYDSNPIRLDLHDKYPACYAYRCPWSTCRGPAHPRSICQTAEISNRDTTNKVGRGRGSSTIRPGKYFVARKGMGLF